MAKAPRPGVAKRAEADAAAVQVVSITVRRELFTKKGRPIPETVVVCTPPNVPLAEEMACRKQTGFPPDYWFTEGQMNLTSVKVWWWLGRRAQGDKALAWLAAEAEWPADLDIEEELDLEIDDPDEEATDPEA